MISNPYKSIWHIISIALKAQRAQNRAQVSCFHLPQLTGLPMAASRSLPWVACAPPHLFGCEAIMESQQASAMFYYYYLVHCLEIYISIIIVNSFKDLIANYYIKWEK